MSIVQQVIKHSDRLVYDRHGSPATPTRRPADEIYGLKKENNKSFPRPWCPVKGSIRASPRLVSPGPAGRCRSWCREAVRHSRVQLLDCHITSGCWCGLPSVCVAHGSPSLRIDLEPTIKRQHVSSMRSNPPNRAKYPLMWAQKSSLSLFGRAQNTDNEGAKCLWRTGNRK